MENTEQKEVFKPLDIRALAKKFKPGLAKFIPGFVYRYFEKILHLEQVNKFAGEHFYDDPPTLFKALVDYFNIQVIWKGAGYEEILSNKGKPFILASNHPFGGPEVGIMMNPLVNDFPDIKVLAQSYMSVYKPFRNCCVFNKSGVKSLLEHVQEKKSLLMFPAGYCSRLLSFKEVFDYEWKPSVVKIAKRNNMPVTVVHVDGQLSKRMINWTKFRNFFHIKASVETVFLIDELYKKSNSQVSIVVGKTISPEAFDDSQDNREWAARLRQYCYNLGKDENAVFDPSVPATLPLK